MRKLLLIVAALVSQIAVAQIETVTPFNIKYPAAADNRLNPVATFADLNTIHDKFNGMIVKVLENGQRYEYDLAGNSWSVFRTASASSIRQNISFQGNNNILNLIVTPDTGIGLSVFLQGVLLQPSQYTLSVTTLTVNSTLLNTGLNYTATVVYDRQVNGSSGNGTTIYTYTTLAEVPIPAPKGFIVVTADTTISTTPALQLYYNDGTATNHNQLYIMPITSLSNILNN